MIKVNGEAYLEGEGMYSMIEKKIPNERMIFKHIGVMKNGNKLPMDEETKKWSGSHESYFLDDNGDSTTLRVEMDIAEEFSEYFKGVFPKALEKVKEISAGN